MVGSGERLHGVTDNTFITGVVAKPMISIDSTTVETLNSQLVMDGMASVATQVSVDVLVRETLSWSWWQH